MSRTLLALLIGGGLGFTGLFAADWALMERAPEPAEWTAPIWEDRFPDVLLQAHDGRAVNFHKDLIEGKIVALNFMYVGCTEF